MLCPELGVYTWKLCADVNQRGKKPRQIIWGGIETNGTVQPSRQFLCHPLVMLAQVCDLICCVWFMYMYWRFSHKIVKIGERAAKENVTPADYAVEVRGIPEDTNDEVRKPKIPSGTAVRIRNNHNLPEMCGESRDFSLSSLLHGFVIHFSARQTFGRRVLASSLQGTIRIEYTCQLLSSCVARSSRDSYPPAHCPPKQRHKLPPHCA